MEDLGQHPDNPGDSMERIGRIYFNSFDIEGTQKYKLFAQGIVWGIY